MKSETTMVHLIQKGSVKVKHKALMALSIWAKHPENRIEIGSLPLVYQKLVGVRDRMNVEEDKMMADSILRDLAKVLVQSR